MATLDATTRTQLVELYVAYFNRAPDANGLNYWAGKIANDGWTVATVARSFMDQTEVASAYPAYMTNAEVVNKVYANVLNRAPDAEGATYWTNQLNSGAVSKADLIMAVVNAAKSSTGTAADAAVVANKTAVGEYFAVTQGLNDVTAARSVMSGVTGDAATVTAANTTTDGYAAVANTVQLTNGIDVVSGNMFTAARGFTPGGTDQVNTLDDDDVLTGTGTNPTLNFTYVDDADLGAGTIITPTFNGIETVNISVQGAAAKRLDLQDAPGINAINVSRVNQANFTTANIASATENLSITNSNAVGRTIAFDYLGSALAGTTDETTLTLNNVNVATVLIEQNGLGLANPLTAQGYETINIVSNGNANTMTTSFRAEDLRTLNISGDASLTIAAFQNAAGSLTRIDGSAAEGALDLTLDGVLSATADGTSGTNVALTVLTGSGDDTLRITADTIGTTDSINMGEGNDTVRLQAGVTNNFTPVATGAALVTGAENLTVVRTANGVAEAATLTVDMARFAGDQVTTLSNLGDAGDAATFALNNMSAGDATGLRITHSSTGNNAIGLNVINADVDAGVTTVGLTILEGNNTDPRFNVTLNADSDNNALNATNSVTNITLTDSDSESNSVLLGQVARHTGTLSVNEGTAGTFLSLDATAGVGYGRIVNGAAGDETTIAEATAEMRDTAVASAFVQGGAGQVGVFSSIAAAGFAGNLEVRLGTSNTNAQLGSGNDTVIFADRAGITAATSGLTNQDTVAGGAGTDTIVLDGTGVMTLGASEWTNLSGVDVIRIAGVAGGTANIRVTDQLVDQTDAGDRITIVNNDGRLTTDGELTANIDLRAMSAANAVTFVGNNSDLSATTVQTVILNDVTANGANILNGGDNGFVSEYVVNGRNFVGVGAGAVFATQAAADAQYVIDRNAGLSGNNNVYRVFNNAEVTVGDLANTSNFSTIQFINDQAVAQTLNLTLDNATVDALVDANHTATATQTETLTIDATNIAANGGSAQAAILNLAAGTVGAQFVLNVTGGAGNDTIVAGAGTDVINGGAGNDTINGGAGNDIITGGTGADTLTGGAGADTFTIANADTGITAVTIDTITDFVSGTDQLNLDVSGAAAGNYLELADADLGAAFGTAGAFAAALAAANAAATSTANEYIFVGNTDAAAVAPTTGGYLFLDVSGDGVVDLAIGLTGVLAAGIAVTDII